MYIHRERERHRVPCLVDVLMRESAKWNLSELLRVPQRLSLALVIGHFLSKEQLWEEVALRALEFERIERNAYLWLDISKKDAWLHLQWWRSADYVAHMFICRSTAPPLSPRWSGPRWPSQVSLSDRAQQTMHSIVMLLGIDVWRPPPPQGDRFNSLNVL